MGNGRGGLLATTSCQHTPRVLGLRTLIRAGGRPHPLWSTYI